MASFENVLEKEIGNKADIAFFKFCFVDVHTDTDIRKLFLEYSKRMNEIQKRYSKTQFIIRLNIM